MHGVALLLTVAAIGVEYGWQPGEDGQLEYIIQIEPELVKTLSEGKVDLLSEIPEELQGVKRFRIRVGTGAVPRKGLEEAQATNLKPGDNIASQPPTLGGGQFQPNDPRSGGTNPRGSPTQGRVLSPPGRTTDDQDPTQPINDDRFTDGTSGGAFPTVGRTPGIGRQASLPRDSNDPTEPLNDRTPVEYDAAGNPRTATSPAPKPVWDSATNQWRTPRSTTGTTGTGAGTNNQPATNTNDPRTSQSQDPRYSDPGYATNPRTGLPEVRRDTTQSPGAYAPNSYPPTNYGPVANQGNQYPANSWQQQPGYNGPPLRDPDPGYYPPPNYATRPAPQYDNRQVGYQVAANTGGNAATNVPAATSATSTTATPASTTAAKPTSSSGRDPNVPWMPLTIMSMLFFASVGLNLYLGWIAHGIYQRYRALLTEVRNVRVATI